MDRKEQREHTKEVIKLLEDAIDHYGFTYVLFSRKLNWFRSINGKEIDYLIDSISKNSYALYIVLPFFWVYLGIDLYEYYKERTLKHDDTVSKIINEFHLYPNDLPHKSWKRNMLEDFEFDEAVLLEIRQDLINEGFLSIDHLSILFSDEKIYF
ncbi:MAG: hypothetical protein AAF806_30185 [Bacteroidota bacterium]